jgi:hypothetical protein
MSILSYDSRSHNPATRILSLYCHMTAEVIIQLHGLCLYTVISLQKSQSSYPDNVAMQSYEDRNHNPATQIRSLYYHMTVEVSYTGYRCLHLTYKDGSFWLGVYYPLNLNSKIIYLTTGDYTSQQALYQNKFTGSAILTTKCWWGSPKVWSNI